MNAAKWFVGLIFLCGINPTMTYAQTDGIPVRVQPIYPQNQADGTKGYFELLVQPRQTQTIYVQVINPTNKPVTVTMRSANGYTSPSGGMMYNPNLDSPDSTIIDPEYKLASNIKIASSITLSANKALNVPIQVTVPNVTTGNMLGGIQFITSGQEKTQTTPTSKGVAKFILKQQAVETIAIQLDLPDTATSNYSIGNAGFDSDRGQTYIEMRNDSAMIQPDVRGSYKITDQSGRTLYDGKIAAFKMAPKTLIRFPFPWNNPVLSAGTYHVLYSGSVGEKPITATRTFDIANQDVKHYTERHPEEIKTQQGIPIWIYIAGAVIFGGLMFWLGRRKPNQR